MSELTKTSLKQNPYQKFFGNLKKLKIKKDHSKKGRVKEFIAKLSQALMLPIAMLPIAGLFLGIGAAIFNQAGDNEGLKIFGNFLKVPGDVIFGALPVLFAVSIAIAYSNNSGAAGLSAVVGFLVFSGLQAGLITEVTEKVGDGATKLLGYNLLFYGPNNLLNAGKPYGLDSSLFSSVLGINQLTTSIFGGFIVGFTVSFLYNRFYNIKLPAIIGFFSGVRFVPVITFLALFPITLIVMMIWPLIGTGFYWIGVGLGGSYFYGFNSFIFGYIERALVPFGLHHAFYSPLWYTSAGGQLDLTAFAKTADEVQFYIKDPLGNYVAATWADIASKLGDYKLKDGTTIFGDQSLWAFANSYLVGKEIYVKVGETYYNHTIQFSDLTRASGADGVNIGQYMQGKFSFMMFGIPAAAAAMVLTAKKENRKAALSIIASAALTSFLTGITEPFEFTFLFLAPWIYYGFHAVMCALSFGFMNWFGLMIPEYAPHIGMTFSGGIIDWVIYGAIQIPFGSNAWWALILGVAYIPIYFFFFYWAIKKFDIKTPGRGDNLKLFTKKDYQAKKDSQKTSDFGIENDQNMNLALNVIKAYGGLDNIVNVNACITKLRVQIKDQSKVDTNKLVNELGAKGTMKPSPQSVYAVYGPDADIIKNDINKIIEQTKKDPSLLAKLFENDNLQNNTISNNSSLNSNDAS